MYKILILISIFCFYCKVTAQTITAADFVNMNNTTRGNGMQTSDITGFNLNPPGGNNTWDFSKLKYTPLDGESFSSSAKLGSNCDNLPEFKDANIYTKSTTNVNGVKYISFSYGKLSQEGYWIYGACTDTFKTFYNPGNQIYKFPMSKGSKWTSTYKIPNAYGESNVTVENEIDASGTAILPNGNNTGVITKNVIRLKSHTVSIANYSGFMITSKSYSYSWLTNYSDGMTIVAGAGADSNNVLNSVSLPGKSSGGKGVYESDNNDFSLKGNFPNPSVNSTSINFEMKNNARAIISLYNFEGKLITILADKTFNKGDQTLKVNISDLSSGLYYYTLNCNNSIAKGVMTITK
jgi:hypothetical protein